MSDVKLNKFYLPLKEDGGLVQFRKSKDGFVIPLCDLDENKKGQHLTIYFKHFKEILKENTSEKVETDEEVEMPEPEELYYLNLHVKDETLDKKIFEEDFYFNVTKIRNIFKYNLKHLFKIIDNIKVSDDDLINNLYSIDEFHKEINLNENIHLLKKRKTANNFFCELDNRELKNIVELKKYPFSEFSLGKDYYSFAENKLYRRVEYDDETFFICYDDFEKIQKDIFEFICNLFPKFKENFSKFVNIVDINFPNFIDMENVEEVLK